MVHKKLINKFSGGNDIKNTWMHGHFHCIVMCNPIQTTFYLNDMITWTAKSWIFIGLVISIQSGKKLGRE